MPSDANGVYSLPNGYLAVAGTTVLPSQHNPPLEDLANAMTGRLATNGANGMTGPLKVIDGTVSTPGVAFGPNSGLYRTTGGNLGISINGTEVAEFGAGGITKGSRYIGEIFDWTGTFAPPLCVFPYGQTLSRTTYADLWTFAQAEIANGNTFYNNGNGSTTFGIGDMRGRIRAAKDNLGGVASAGRLTTATISPNPFTIGAAGGVETVSLSLAQLPTGIQSTNLASIPITVATNQKVLNGPNTGSAVAGGSQVTAADAGSGGNLNFLGSTGSLSNGSVVVTSNNTSGAAHSNVMPAMIFNCALFAGA